LEKELDEIEIKMKTSPLTPLLSGGDGDMKLIETYTSLLEQFNNI
jgi:hypothetical protein